MKLVSTNPGRNYQEIGSVDISTDDEIKQKVKQARNAAQMWKETSLKERISYFEKLLEVYKRRGKEVAELQTQEVGKPISESLGDVEGDLGNITNKIKQAPEYLAPQVLDTSDTQKNVLYFEPYGVAAVIVPWNFPSGNFFIACNQLLLAGNTVVFKHSEECPLTGKLLEEIMHESGFPEGVFSEVYGDGKVGDVLTDQDVDLIHFTGSTKVGQYLYEKAAKKFIPVLLEMGGSSPGIIFEGADISNSCLHVCQVRFLNCGQSCDALKRLIVHESMVEQIIETMKKNIEGLVVGDPMDEETTLGPLVAKRQLDLLIEQVEDAKAKGAVVVTGGRKSDNFSGAYYQPTLLTNVTSNMRVVTEEVFGPVLPIIPFKTEEEAIAIANNTPYGLSAYMYGENIDQLRKVASQVDSGLISINGASYFSPNSPFGGYKKSGMGRNDGKLGFYEVSQKKVVAEPLEK